MVASESYISIGKNLAITAMKKLKYLLLSNLKVFKNKIKLPQIPKNHFVYTFIGNISKYKMLECVIKSFESLKKDIDNLNRYHKEVYEKNISFSITN